MHVKPLRSELCVDLSGFRTPPRAVSGGGRRPLSAIAGNTLRGRAAPPPLSLCPAKDDPAAFLDMCAVIKPGHVREKIALFAPDPGSVRAGRAPSTRAGKVKSSRRENGDAKRRRRSAGHKNLRRDPGALPGNGPPAGASDQSLTEGAEHQVSVGAMVAFLEQRRRSGARHARLAMARMPPLPEDPESVRVSDVVAKLECLQRRDEGGSFTRPRRWVGRLLLTAGPALSPLPSPSADTRCDDPTERSPSPPPGGAAAPETPPSLGETEPPPGLLFLSAPSPPSPRIRSYESEAEQAEAADDFAEMRRRLRELLEPPPTLATLPQDVLVGVFVLLPTRTLAALKCTCRYFKSVIENYGVRPADSLWVSDPRYRDDPCKKCKRRYGRGDVSLCRWHHKPYCQALPFGPGFWLCCHRLRRDAPGCNVGLHDNRWVPACCAVGVAVCRRSADD
ncbi:F-box only protein 34 [Hippocampus comes]|uniref:F-box protein 34 n=1 Tax=Hippocampus comes TaxID=109280 RepID=A0A3Q2XJI0_HIPCM|nr:PREDICTED: F-box only protein 46-like [Hippocampus comes]